MCEILVLGKYMQMHFWLCVSYQNVAVAAVARNFWFR